MQQPSPPPQATTPPQASSKQASQAESHFTISDVYIKLMNLYMLLVETRKGSNFRWSNSMRDSVSFVGQFAENQYTKIYGRISPKYKYHPQQRFENAIRKFNASPALAADLSASGTNAFYARVCGHTNFSGIVNNECDLTLIDQLSTIKNSADYVFKDVFERKGPVAAQKARDAYARGYSRAIDVRSTADWEAFRNELRAGRPYDTQPDTVDKNVTLVALSYKGQSIKLTRRMKVLTQDGSPEEESVLQQFEVSMTSDFLDDFRWSQMVGSCRALANTAGTHHVRIWIDRLVNMGKDFKKVSEFYSMVDWEDFGLFAYAVCPVVRVYDLNEKYFGTDFWRKLETVLGVAGRGLLVDDYMLRKFDSTIYYGSSIYNRLGNGLARIGGDGIYLRATTLALATALLTDSVSVREANEDMRTQRAASAWKAWALRTIAEGAYSKRHSSMMMKGEQFRIRFREFYTIVFWESITCRSDALVGENYLDMSMQRSMDYRKAPGWDGVLEWVGILPGSCNVVDRKAIMDFLDHRVSMSLYASTTGHVAGIMTLLSDDRMHKRTLVVDLARFSTMREGHVTAVAEATGLWDKTLLPPHLVHRVDPDEDQQAEVTDDGILITCKPMRLEYVWYRPLRIMFFLTINIILIKFTLGAWLFVGAVQLWAFWKPWPWVDVCDVGEALFHNLLLHGLFGSGVKKQYRNLRTDEVRYSQLSWN